MRKCSFQYSNGQSVFTKEFTAHDRKRVYLEVLATLMRTGCELVPHSIMFGKDRIPDLPSDFRRYREPRAVMFPQDPWMRNALVEHFFPGSPK